MERTIKTPQDVVQDLIDIIVTNESEINIFTQYYSSLLKVIVTINTYSYLYICYYKMTGDRVEIRKFRKKHDSSTKVLVSCSFRVHGKYTDYISTESFPEKIKIINL